MRFRRPRTALSCAVLAFLAVAVACEEPTQVTVRITTNERCEKLSDVQTIVGPNPNEIQERFKREYSTGTTDRCDPDGFIGTLVVTPGGGAGSVLVAVGVAGSDGTPPPDPTKCFEAETSKRCIIARRTFSFIDAKPLVLPINLDPLCTGQACDPASTCFKGTCVSANVVCVGAECGLPEEDPGGVGNGNDASSGDGAYDGDLDGPALEDVNLADTSPPIDATADAAEAGMFPTCGVSSASGFDGGPRGSHFCSVGSNHGTNNTPECGGNTNCCRCSCPGTGISRGCSTMSCFFSCS